MDAIDRKILSELQHNGRISITDLAQRVGLSLSSCHRRVRDLEASGAIESYRAVISPGAIGLEFEAIVFATLAATDRDTLDKLDAAVAAIPNIVEAERLFGDTDYLLRVVTRDIAEFQELYDRNIGSLPGTHRVSSTPVMKRVVTGRRLPL